MPFCTSAYSANVPTPIQAGAALLWPSGRSAPEAEDPGTALEEQQRAFHEAAALGRIVLAASPLGVIRVFENLGLPQWSK